MKKPWNLPDLPVYSLSTMFEGNGNMNICTYVSAISMTPKLYMVAVYDNTHTMDMLLQSDYAVLQLMNKADYRLTAKLGKQNGKRFDKISFLHKKGCLDSWNGFHVLKNACAWILLKKTKTMETGGDHRLFVFAAENFKSQSDDILTTHFLIDKGLIRA
jgi:flavin reductase (DIM6/NTAB) family NADH-FMN oxidoreductase RutF